MFDAARRRNRSSIVAAALLTGQIALMLHAITWNAPTFDEPYHLTAGLRYWDTGEFWCYHHNPPLIRLTATLPLVLVNVPRVTGDDTFQLHDRSVDELVKEDFTRLHSRDFPFWLNVARCTQLGFVVLGGWVIFLWSREMFGDWGGLLSLSLWVGSPWILGHGMLVTGDVPAAAMMLAASYAFWVYLKSPSLECAAISGLLLGLAQSTKFTAISLVPVWMVAAIYWVISRRRNASGSLGKSTLALPAIVVLVVSLLSLNSVYLFEETGVPLGEFEFRSNTLSRPANIGADDEERPNRFRGTFVEAWPVPLPRHYVLGFDDQLWDLQARPWPKYLRGELRTGQQSGWLYYYAYCFVVKTPVAGLLMIAIAVCLLASSKYRRDFSSEVLLLVMPAVILLSLSLNTNLNSHGRYLIPAMPFLFVSAGRVNGIIPQGIRLRAVVLAATGGLVILTGAAAHPHHLAYFNAPAGGPAEGVRHLCDSNLDWGQGLIALHDWLDTHAPGAEVQMAYFGALNPDQFGITYRMLDPPSAGPGIHIVSATLVAGMPASIHAPGGCRAFASPNAYTGYQRLTPVARPGYSLFVFDVDDEELRQLQNPDDAKRTPAFVDGLAAR